MKHGKGVMTYSPGNVYEGEWNKNVKSGHGTMVWESMGEKYTGEWKVRVMRLHPEPSHVKLCLTLGRLAEWLW
jgi:hypothetical protein